MRLSLWGTDESHFVRLSLWGTDGSHFVRLSLWGTDGSHFYRLSLWGTDTLSNRQLSKQFCFHSESLLLKGKNILPPVGVGVVGGGGGGEQIAVYSFRAAPFSEAA